MPARITTLVVAVALLATSFVPGSPPAAAQPTVPPAPALSASATGIIGSTPVGPLVRLFAAFGRRNGVYREAGRTQREIRDYYDRQVDTARRLQEERDQTRQSDDRAAAQYRAYLGARVHLENERARALELTEDEKRAARQTFKETAEREIANIVLNTPGALGAIGELRRRVDEVRERIADIRNAINNGNPFSSIIDELNEKLDRLARIRSIAGTVHGPTGQRLGALEAEVRKHVERLSSIRDEANSALDEIDALGDQALAALDRLDREEPALTDLVYDALAAEVERLLIPDPEAPNEDVLAVTLLERLAKDFPQLFAEIDDLATMRQRVRATLIRDTLIRIGTRCGKLVGALRRAAAAGGDDVELPEDSPCALFAPQKLIDFIKALQDEDDAGDDSESTSTTGGGSEPPDDLAPEVVAILDAIPDGTYAGTMDESVWTASNYEVLESTATLTKSGYDMRLEIDFTVATDLGAGCTELLTETIDAELTGGDTGSSGPYLSLVGPYVRHQRGADGCEVPFDYGDDPVENSVIIQRDQVSSSSLQLELGQTPFAFDLT